VLPSDARETWGLVVNEAMACGRPAMVSTSAGCCEDLINDRTGWSFALGDYETLARLMERVAGNVEALTSKGRNAKKLVTEQYSIARATQGLCKAIHRLRNDASLRTA
jgi:glycosyltransferase involved in cell wall biosynthesis